MAELTLDSPELTQNDYRALREGRDVPEKLSEAAPADEPADAESATDPDAVEPTEEPPSSSPKDQRPPKRGMVSEIVKLRQEKRELEARLAQPPPPKPPAAEEKPAPAAPIPVPADDPEPDANKYSDYNLLLKDQIAHGVRQALRQQAAENATREQRTAEQRAAEAWQDRIKAATAEHPDFHAVALNNDLPITVPMGRAITDSEVGAAILYHLGQNGAEAARISKLTPIGQIREIGKLEALLAAPVVNEEEDEEPPTPITVSKAPAPIARPAGGRVSKPNLISRIETMTQEEYRAARESGRIR